MGQAVEARLPHQQAGNASHFEKRRTDRPSVLLYGIDFLNGRGEGCSR